MVNNKDLLELNAELTRLRSEVGLLRAQIGRGRSEVGLLRAQLKRHNVPAPEQPDVYPMLVEWLINKKSRATIADEMGLSKFRVIALTNKWLSTRVNLSAIKSEHATMVWHMRLQVLCSGCRDSDTVTNYYKIAKENAANRSVLAEIASTIKKMERIEEEDRRAEEEDRRARVEQFVCKVRAQQASMAMQDGPRPIAPIDLSYCRGLGLTPADIPDDLIGAQLIVRDMWARYSEPVVVRLGVSRMEV
jgi:hypothetical protein